jgi:hypothetical protein
MTKNFQFTRATTSKKDLFEIKAFWAKYIVMFFPINIITNQYVERFKQVSNYTTCL